MEKVISVSALKRALGRSLGCYTLCDNGDIDKVIDSVPFYYSSTSESTWLDLEGFWNRARCSACGGETIQKTPFCPHCGAKMLDE